jgi:hypothetical protein
MPIHDWTRVDISVFHSFHLGWVSEISRVLNNGLLPDSYYALSETIINEPDTGYLYAVRAVAVRHVHGDRLTAIAEMVSPESKNELNRLIGFVGKAKEALDAGVHLLLIDLFSPGPRDPLGIHGAVWEEMMGELYEMPPDKRLTLVSYAAGPDKTAYIEPIAVGDSLPDMPLFLNPDEYINVPLETTYQMAWRGVPKRWRDVLEPSSGAS